jgi:hypothetical protein
MLRPKHPLPPSQTGISRKFNGGTDVPAAAAVGTTAAAENKDWRMNAPGVVLASLAIDVIP